MDRLPKIARLCWLTALLLGLATASRADDGAKSFVMNRQSQVSTLLRGPSGPLRERRIGEVLDSMLDYDELAKRSMGNHWEGLTAAQRKEFSGLLKRLVQRSYERNIKGILDWNVEYLDEEASPPGVTIHTRATSRTNPRAEPVTIDYHLSRTPESYRVFDIVTEGSSLVNNYRNQFNRIMQKDGFDALIKRMKAKIEQGGEAHAK